MAHLLDELAPRAALVEIARDFHARGWMAGTAGNLSARADPEHFWITASGLPKGRLDEGDFVLVRVKDGAVVERGCGGHTPSAESAIHAAIYASFPHAHACLHGHSVAACLATARTRPAARMLRLPALEMLKGLGVWEQNVRVDLPLFKNHAEVARIAREVRKRFAGTRPPLDALLVRDHGPTVWGAGPQEAYNRFEVLDFLLSYVAGKH